VVGKALRVVGKALRVVGKALRAVGRALRLVGKALRLAALFAGFGLAATDFRARLTGLFAEVRDTALAEVRDTALAALRAGAFAPLVAFTMCLGRAALVFNGRRLVADFGDDCLAAERLIPFATGLLM
ncbi:MAG TPA: hypothetical protein VN920_06390, partial [Pyrinomonadaceae bacterium]|nr:hypothetical protein [Pyrinomonadaceae bacterium]